MGKGEKKEDINIYRKLREDMDYTREKASELIGFVSASRIEKYETGKSPVRPEEVLAMEDIYKPADIDLCNYYCSHECPIGQKYVPQLEIKDLSNLVLQLLTSITTFEKSKERLMEIAADGEVSDDELLDFIRIKEGTEKISLAVDSLTIWINHMISSGKIDLSKAEDIISIRK